MDGAADLSPAELAEMRREIASRLDALLDPSASGPTTHHGGSDAHDAPPNDGRGDAPSRTPVPMSQDADAAPAAEPSTRAADATEERLRQARQRMAERQAEAERAASEAGAARGRHAGGWLRLSVGAAVVVAAALLVLRLAGG